MLISLLSVTRQSSGRGHRLAHTCSHHVLTIKEQLRLTLLDADRVQGHRSQSSMPAANPP